MQRRSGALIKLPKLATLKFHPKHYMKTKSKNYFYFNLHTYIHSKRDKIQKFYNDSMYFMPTNLQSNKPSHLLGSTPYLKFDIYLHPTALRAAFNTSNTPKKLFFLLLPNFNCLHSCLNNSPEQLATSFSNLSVVDCCPLTSSKAAFHKYQNPFEASQRGTQIYFFISLQQSF